MTETLLFTLLAIGMLAAVGALLRTPTEFRSPSAEQLKISLEELAASHCRFFPQLRQALSPSDEAFLAERASPAVLREWRETRSRVLREFLAGLYDDFARLNRLARAVSRMAPQLDTLREAELFSMDLRFRLLYHLALAELSLGRRPADALPRLADMVGALGSAMEKAASALAAESALDRPTALIS